MKIKQKKDKIQILLDKEEARALSCLLGETSFDQDKEALMLFHQFAKPQANKFAKRIFYLWSKLDLFGFYGSLN